MKKMLYLILPALFLAAGANFAFAQVEEIKTLTPEQREALAAGKEKIKALTANLEQEKTRINGEYMAINPKQAVIEEMVKEQEAVGGFPIYKFKLGETIDFKKFYDKNEAKSVYIIINLKPNKNYVLIDPKTREVLTQRTMQYTWDNFTGMYNYIFHFALATGDNPYIVIRLEPIKTKEQTIPAKLYGYSMENQDKTIDLHLFANAIDGKSAVAVKILQEK